ncbi:MAG: adenine-specific methyltransferase EcoRI family protein, partial [Candidatus Saccharibacteria bacterium]|nr:adenine-specific methyltransferase EcoRI family protein [Candidatus Saccharibacteria bacterium]
MLHRANRAKVDEFYTQLSVIEKEMRNYRQHFKDKVVFCNCDDPFESNFFKYFAMNFNYLGLKKLICTCYDGSPVSYTELKDSIVL